MLLNKPWSLWFFFVFAIPAFAQDKFSDDLRFSLNYHYGAVLPEYSSFIYVVNKNVNSFGFSLSKKTTGRNDYEQLFNYPEYGISFFCSTLGNDEIHGQEYALFPYFRLNILSRRRFNLFNETGLGFSFVTKKFDLTKNYLNIAVGSHLNIHFNLKLGVDVRLSDKLKLQGGASFDHFSNANTFEPNLGINYITGFTGLQYLMTSETERSRHELQPHMAGHDLELIMSVGGKHPKGPETAMFFTSSMTFEYKLRSFRALHFGAGADVFFDASTEAEMMSEFRPVTFREIYNFRTGVHLSQEFVYDKLSLIIQAGIYLGLTDKVDKNIMYNRGIIRYRVSEKMFVQMAMKSHLHILDFPELGAGVKL